MKVAIVGGCPSTSEMAPYDNPEWQIWGMQNRTPQYKRADLLFEIHAPGHFHTDEAWQNYLSEYGKQIEALRSQGRLIDHTNYPYDDAIALRGRWTLQGSVSYMLAYAVLQGATEIALFGVDLIDNHEYIMQKPHVEGWIGFIEGRGTKIWWPPESALGAYPYKYGIEPYNSLTYKGVGKTAIAQMLMNALRQCEQARTRYAAHPELVDQINNEARCYHNVLTAVREEQRGASIENAIVLPFDEIDRQLEAAGRNHTGAENER